VPGSRGSATVGSTPRGDAAAAATPARSERPGSVNSEAPGWSKSPIGGKGEEKMKTHQRILYPACLVKETVRQHASQGNLGRQLKVVHFLHNLLRLLQPRDLSAEHRAGRRANSNIDITIIAANVTGWNSAKLFLQEQAADISLVQEIKRRGADSDQAKTIFAQLGYYSGVADSFETDKGGLSSGVAILWKRWIHVLTPPMSLWKSRCLVVSMQVAGFGEVYSCCVDGVTKNGFAAKQGIYTNIMGHVERHGKPFIIGGDHNMESKELAAVIALRTWVFSHSLCSNILHSLPAFRVQVILIVSTTSLCPMCWQQRAVTPRSYNIMDLPLMSQCRLC
jgi:hypothetical protein